MDLVVSAPNRIDLAGGTTDIYPLYLLMDGGFTVNVAITVDSTVTFRSQSVAGIRIMSEDLGEKITVPEASLLPRDGPLGLIARAVQAISPVGSYEITTLNKAPKGSGLGASSALLVALLSGLFKLSKKQESPRAIVELATNIETSLIGVPAGQQDYIAAMHGGVSIIEFGNKTSEKDVEDLKILLEDISKRYNFRWSVFKSMALEELK